MALFIFLALTLAGIAFAARRSGLESGMSEYCRLECLCCK